MSVKLNVQISSFGSHFFLKKNTTLFFNHYFFRSQMYANHVKFFYTLNLFYTRVELRSRLCFHFEKSSPEKLPCFLLHLDNIESSPWHGSDKDRASGGRRLLAVGATRCVSGSCCPSSPPHHAVLHAPVAATSTRVPRSPRQIGPIAGYID